MALSHLHKLLVFRRTCVHGVNGMVVVHVFKSACQLGMLKNCTGSQIN